MLAFLFWSESKRYFTTENTEDREEIKEELKGRGEG
jgi:hypothetical protein